MSCVFCAIAAGEAPAIRIYEDDGYLAFLDIRPFTRGHTLVVPKQHTVDLTDTPPETVADMVTIGQRIAKAARATELADATNIGINDGRAAFQSVFHIHLHMLPRWVGDTNFMTVTGETRVHPEDLKTTYERLSKALKA